MQFSKRSISSKGSVGLATWQAASTQQPLKHPISARTGALRATEDRQCPLFIYLLEAFRYPGTDNEMRTSGEGGTQCQRWLGLPSLTAGSDRPTALPQHVSPARQLLRDKILSGSLSPTWMVTEVVCWAGQTGDGWSRTVSLRFPWALSYVPRPGAHPQALLILVLSSFVIKVMFFKMAVMWHVFIA